MSYYFGVDRGVEVAEEVLEEGLEIESLAVEDTEVAELVEALIQYGLDLLLGQVLLLDLGEEPAEVMDAHEAILRVLLEQGLDLRRGLRYGQAEAAAEAEAHAVGLF